MSCLSFDYQYIKIAREILEEGVEVVGRNNLRYKQMFGQTIKVDLRDGFPALTLRLMPPYLAGPLSRPPTDMLT